MNNHDLDILNTMLREGLFAAAYRLVDQVPATKAHIESINAVSQQYGVTYEPQADHPTAWQARYAWHEKAECSAPPKQ